MLDVSIATCKVVIRSQFCSFSIFSYLMSSLSFPDLNCTSMRLHRDIVIVPQTRSIHHDSSIATCLPEPMTRVDTLFRTTHAKSCTIFTLDPCAMHGIHE
jgi:hypothetical protein